MKRIYLIDCPGIVPPSKGDTEEDILLRGVVRVENVEHPAQYIPAVLKRTQPKHIERTYEIKHSEYDDDAVEFLSIIARKGGRLLKGGEADVDGVAKMVLNDFLRGKIPWFTPTPKTDGDKSEESAKKEVVEGREGRLGEMPSKRKVEASVAATQDDPVEGDGQDFESFSDDEEAQDDLLRSDLDDDDDEEHRNADESNDDDDDHETGVGIAGDEEVEAEN